MNFKKKGGQKFDRTKVRLFPPIRTFVRSNLCPDPLQIYVEEDLQLWPGKTRKLWEDVYKHDCIIGLIKRNN